MSGVGGKAATNATSGGGVTPQMQSYADFTGAEQSVQGASNFSQIPIGTGETFAAGVGPAAMTAYTAMRQSDALAAAKQAQQASKNNSTIGGAQSAIGGLGSFLGG